LGCSNAKVPATTVDLLAFAQAFLRKIGKDLFIPEDEVNNFMTNLQAECLGITSADNQSKIHGRIEQLLSDNQAYAQRLWTSTQTVCTSLFAFSRCFGLMFSSSF